MGSYDTRRVVLDAGLTALALRGLRQPGGHYPFIDRAAGAQRRPPSSRGVGPSARAWRRLVDWCLPGRRSTLPT
jgi:hypothetical protein